MDADRPIAVVGIGASAGGVEALPSFFKRLSADTGLGFIVVTHLARGQPSALPDIIGRSTGIPTRVAKDNQVIEADHIFVCPPDHILTVESNVIRLHERTSEQQRRPIDVFLSSLGESFGDDAIGVLLSGAGTDGTLGMKSIKERGGLTLAQGSDGTSPKYSGMPDTAIAAGVVDLILPVEEMAKRLAEHASGLRTARAQTVQQQLAQNDATEEAWKAIYAILFKQIGHDFRGYKENSFMRRVRRRMEVLQVAEIARYVEKLEADPDEVTLLFKDLLISVTTFFRDSGAFETLRTFVIPKIFENKGANDTVRVWVPGCATGEEVYSIGVLIREHLDTLRIAPKVQIFATDIDEAALAIARSGRYPAPLMNNVTPERLKRYFTGDDVTYSVKKEIRDLCIFSSHSLVRDPPFSRIDLISCRNLLIYFGAEFQDQAIPVFHFALKQHGFLFLGTSENISRHGNLFEPIDRKHRIFQRRDHVVIPLQFPHFSPHGRDQPRQRTLETAVVAPTVRRAVETRVLDRHAPAHVVVNRDSDILYFSARTGKYLEAAPGLPTRQLTAMARHGLRLDLRAAMREVAATRAAVTRRNVAVQIDDRVQIVDIAVEPLGETENDPLYLVLFSDVGTPFKPSEEQARRDRRDDEQGRDIDRLEGEVRETRQQLQHDSEEYEAASEELKSSNEELQSLNEELQSTNEELETSKEELQSVNEELHTVNSQLNVKMEEMDQANIVLRNVFDSMLATVFLDQKFIIRNFTPAARQIFNLISSDKGRPLTDIVHHLDDAKSLQRDIQSVIGNAAPIERQIRRADGEAHYLMRILPYRGHHDRIEGTLVTFVDVTRAVEAEAHQRSLVGELNHRVSNMLLVVGSIVRQTLRSSASLEAFSTAFLGRLEAMARSYTLLSREQWKETKLKDILLNELEPLGDQIAQRFSMDGMSLTFTPAQSLSLGLVFHELVTNAIKYGALSVNEGKVAVRWTAGPTSLQILWEERDGPPVKAPSRKGVGSQLVERELQAAFNADVRFAYEPNGLRIHMTIPADRIRLP